MQTLNEIPEFVRTLFASGFEVLSVSHKPNFTLIDAVRHDEFGLAHKYLFAYSGDQAVSDADLNILTKLSDPHRSPLVLINDRLAAYEPLLILTREQFFGKVGGAVSSVLALEPDYSRRLVQLALNRCPADLRGKPDDLLELYVHAGLQFLLRGRVIRYGQERRFEAVADGISVGKNTPLLLYDCKSSDGRYDITKTTIRQFTDYVGDFHKRYERSVGRLYAFLVISSEFQDTDTLRERSDELYANCGIPLVCMTAETLSTLVTLFTKYVALRSVVDWKNILRAPLVERARAEAEIDARMRDRIAQV